jgi:hypothetical protein
MERFYRKLFVLAIGTTKLSVEYTIMASKAADLITKTEAHLEQEMETVVALEVEYTNSWFFSGLFGTTYILLFVQPFNISHSHYLTFVDWKKVSYSYFHNIGWDVYLLHLITNFIFSFYVLVDQMVSCLI